MPGDLVAGVRGKAWIVHRRHSRMRREELSQSQCVPTVSLRAHRQRLDAVQEDPGGKGAHGAAQAREETTHLPHDGFRAADDSTEDCTMPGEILCCTVHD